jgi:DNA-binding HxlR family transcriptional regulator
MPPNASRKSPSRPLEKFFERVEGRTQDPVLGRLVNAARQDEPADALERELKKIIQEILDET